MKGTPKKLPVPSVIADQMRHGRPKRELKPIPTEWRGITFRSRLEATWAAFFDEISWQWEYEPQQLDGYIPDFGMKFWATDTIIEIKPALRVEALEEFKPKIMKSGWHGEAIIVGSGPWDALSAWPTLGLIGTREEIRGELEWLWGVAKLFTCLHCNGLSVLAEDVGWHCRVCGEGQGNDHVLRANETVPEAWSRAKNNVQWRKPKP